MREREREKQNVRKYLTYIMVCCQRSTPYTTPSFHSAQELTVKQHTHAADSEVNSFHVVYKTINKPPVQTQDDKDAEANISNVVCILHSLAPLLVRCLSTVTLGGNQLRQIGNGAKTNTCRRESKEPRAISQSCTALV